MGWGGVTVHGGGRHAPVHKPDTATIQPTSNSAQPSVNMLTMANLADTRPPRLRHRCSLRPCDDKVHHEKNSGKSSRLIGFSEDGGRKYLKAASHLRGNLECGESEDSGERGFF